MTMMVLVDVVLRMLSLMLFLYVAVLVAVVVAAAVVDVAVVAAVVAAVAAAVAATVAATVAVACLLVCLFVWFVCCCNSFRCRLLLSLPLPTSDAVTAAVVGAAAVAVTSCNCCSWLQLLPLVAAIGSTMLNVEVNALQLLNQYDYHATGLPSPHLSLHIALLAAALLWL